MNALLLFLVSVGASAALALPGGARINRRALNRFPLLKVESGPGRTNLTKQDTIIGRISGSESEHPYVAALIFDDNVFSAGSLITKRTILTGSISLYDVSSAVAYFGSVTISNRKAYQTTNIISHPDYDGNLLNDIALLIFSEDIEGENIRPVPLMCAGSLEGEFPLLCGWEITENRDDVDLDLTCAQAPLITSDECAAMFGSPELDDSFFCTTHPLMIDDVCSGNGGSPLTRFYTGEQIGIATYDAYFSCYWGLPIIYMRMSALCPWIHENAVGDFP